MERVLCNIFLCMLCVDGFTRCTFSRPAARSSTSTHHVHQKQKNALEPSSSPVPAITERIIDLTQKEDIVFVIDVENVRGKTSFELDHCDLLDRLSIWASLRHNAFGRTLAVVDHGSKSSAHLLNDGLDTANAALCVSFAGPIVKADDIIARDVRWLLSSNATQHVVVITADQELSWRCRSAARSPDSMKFNSVLRKLASSDTVLRGGGRGKRGKGGRKKSRAARKKQYMQLHQESEEEVEEESDDVDNNGIDLQSNHAADDTADLAPTSTVEIIAPQRFLEDLEQALREWLYEQEHSVAAEEIDIGDIPIPTPITTMQTLFCLCGEILSIESSLRKKCSLRKRHTLTEELREKKAEWKELLLTQRNSADQHHDLLSSSLAWSLSSFTSQEVGPEPLSPFQSSSISTTPWEDLTSDEQEKLLKRWGKQRGRHGTKREKTEDRIVLAERLRRQLELVEIPTCRDEEASLAQLYGDYINSVKDL